MRNYLLGTLIGILTVILFFGCLQSEPQGSVTPVNLATEAPAAEATKEVGATGSTGEVTENKTPSEEPAGKVTEDKTPSAEPAEKTGTKPSDEKNVKKLWFVIKTDKGIMEGELYPDSAPNTVLNFVTLAKKGFYDGLNFHRVVDDFVIQGGDPKGNGSGGPGYKIPAEFNSRKHMPGTLSMARSQDPDSAGSQFFICLSRKTCQHLDGQYTVFGQVIEGLDVSQKIKEGDKIKEIKIEGDLPKELQGKEVKKSSLGD